jgi:hypothetical protein
MWKRISPFNSFGISRNIWKNLKYYHCNREIGEKETYLDKRVENNDKDNKKDKLIKALEPINRNKYYIIFNDKDDIDELNKNADTRNMLQKKMYDKKRF